MTQKHLIVTGMGGFLGRCAVAHFAALGFRVTGIGHGIPPAVSGDVDCRVGDVSRESLRALIAERGRPTVLLHAAGTGSVAAAAADPAKETARTIGTLEAAIAALRELSPDATLVYPSSVAVYGDTGPQPAPESFPLRPQSEYARLKVSAEALCLERSPGPCAVLRFSSLYGPGLRKQLLWDLSKRLRDGSRLLDLGGTGEESRDFLHGADAARIIALAAERR